MAEHHVSQPEALTSEVRSFPGQDVEVLLAVELRDGTAGPFEQFNN
jgi:hypothetical protein